MILLDTNVISEPLRPSPAEAPVAWLRGQSIETIYLSTITIAELHAGLEALPVGKRHTTLREGIVNIEAAFKGRILPLDMRAAVELGSVIVRAKAAGNPIAFADAAIAAIALAHGLTVATRDANDFRATGVRIINPWT